MAWVTASWASSSCLPGETARCAHQSCQASRPETGDSEPVMRAIAAWASVSSLSVDEVGVGCAMSRPMFQCMRPLYRKHGRGFFPDAQ